jgi:hypothetical protein
MGGLYALDQSNLLFHFHPLSYHPGDKTIDVDN